MADKANNKQRRCCSWKLLCALPFVSFIVALVAVVVSVSVLRRGDGEKEWSLMSQHHNVVHPPAVHARYRMQDYQHLDNYFFQWWNFLVFDGLTRNHYNVIVHLTNFSSTSNSIDTVSIRMAHLLSNEAVNVVNDVRPLAAASVTRYADVTVNIKDQQGKLIQPYSMTFDDDTINIKAKFPSADFSLQNIKTEWDITFHRVHGVYLGEANEAGNAASGDRCLVVSNLFAYNSLVSGYVKENDQLIRFDVDGQDKNRYRAYAAGSWGCQLPTGSPAVNYPWTWFWLVIPGALSSKLPSSSSSASSSSSRMENGDLSFVFGTAKFASALGDLYGGYSITGGLPNTPASASSSSSSSSSPTSSSSSHSHILSTQNVYLFHNSSLELPVEASSSDSYVSHYKVELHEWANFVDSYGEARLPLQQIYRVQTRCYSLLVDFHSKLEQYFRAPVAIEKDNKLRVFSDFRAVGVTTDVTVKLRAQCSESGAEELIYSGTVDTMNALEFAYEPELDIQQWAVLQGKLRD